MAVFSIVGRSIRHQLRQSSQPYFKQLFDSNPSRYDIISLHGQFQIVRTLILESASRCLKINRLSGSDSGIAEMCLDRPQAKNAIGKDLLREFKLSLEDINNDPSVNILLITSLVPKVFCAGADLKERKTMDPSEVRTFVNSLRSSFSYLEALRIPSIAVIEGAALGGGLELALSCDLRICGESAIMGLPETGLAIIPGAGGTQRLPRLVGKSVAKELIFTGRKFSGSEAASMGIVNYCVPSGEARFKALEMAQEINQKGPVAIRMAKQAIDEGFELDLSMALELEEDCYENLLHTKDRLEGLAAFAEKRKPRYTGE
ncbi:probable enoyl-CoA hydratase 2, mitochondrial [Impatiens glandulifera]|uniref:probable enoyl-CoA hydratase 2, mitochondrial n=1 Tax=Impatiens glandulifera TaxID=253017 RepID=UPI001FB10F7B|nr:probable enoyl-CoA hydratase 2, mitochondrial [Impatiens glandulifera]